MGFHKPTFRPVLTTCLAAPLLLAALAGWYLLDLPDVSPLKKKNPGRTEFMRLHEERAREAKKPWTFRQQWVPLDSVSPLLQNAVRLAEDANFYGHDGVDYEELKVALAKNIDEKRIAMGASTITQQLAKNLYLSPSKNPFRKLKEFFIAGRLEKSLGKRRILEIYLNVVEWGDGVYGAEAASRFHFGKAASDLSPEEAVALAIALPAPKKFGPGKDSKYLSRRRRNLLAKLRKHGYLPAEPAAETPAAGTQAEEEVLDAEDAPLEEAVEEADADEPLLLPASEPVLSTPSAPAAPVSASPVAR